MTEHRLDEADVGTVIEHQGRHGVAEDVTGTGLVDAGGLDVFLHQVGQAIVVERLAVLVQEQIAVIRFHDQRGRTSSGYWSIQWQAR